MNKKNNETTLTQLTKRFVKLLNSNSERVINLNEASTRLSVAKRRIYDITNVLEGIGLLQKTSKNVTRWVDCPRDSPFAAPSPPLEDTKPGIPKADDELAALMETYQNLESCIAQLEASRRQQLSGEEAYVTYNDFKSASFNDDQIVIAVHGPSDSNLEVSEHLQIHISTSNQGEKIEVYLYHTNANQQQQQQLQHVYATSSDEGNGMSIVPTTTTTDATGVSTDNYNDDPTFSSALYSEEEEPFQPVVPFDGQEEPHYTYLFDQDVSDLFPEEYIYS